MSYSASHSTEPGEAGTARTGVAVVVATRDRPTLLAGCLDAIRATLRPGDELVVVDSASTARSTREVAELAGARYIRCDQPGASVARNVGVAATSAAIVAITDDDCRPRAGWLQALERALADTSVGFVTGRVEPEPPDAAQPASETGTEPRTFGRAADPMHMGHSANVAIRRAAFTQVGGFDEMLGPGGRFRAANDHDLFWRILAAGWEGRYEPEAVVGHVAWRTARGLLGKEFVYGVGTGAFAAKVMRLDRAAGRALLRARIWDEGIVLAARLLRRGWERPALTQLVKVAGVVTGAVRAARVRVVDGHFAARGEP